MTKQSYAEMVNQCRVLVDALRANRETMPQSLREQFTNKLDGDLAQIVQLNKLQEKLKADLKEQTAKVEALSKSLQTQYAEAKKRIKLDVPADRWREFGIEDKR